MTLMQQEIHQQPETVRAVAHAEFESIGRLAKAVRPRRIAYLHHPVAPGFRLWASDLRISPPPPSGEKVRGIFAVTRCVLPSPSVDSYRGAILGPAAQ